MGLLRNATAAERIAYLWSQSSTMIKTYVSEGTTKTCTVGTTVLFSHYAMEIAGQIIAEKTAQKFKIPLVKTDPTATGVWYGGYMQYFVVPSGAFFQANNLATEAWPKEIWYNSPNNCDPEWNRKWAQGQPKISCAYSTDFFARPGSGTIVASARDFVRLLSNISFGGVFYGGLPGTSSIILGQMSPTTSLNFAIVVNQEVETPNSPFASDLEQKVQTYLTGVTKWPTIDLF